jgi:L-alanine-DL-glutamate epimerase-like enolase superfamily enzyme
MTNTISKIEIFKSPIPLKEPFVISLGPLFSADNLLVKIETEEGLLGWGECSPFRTIHGESQETGFIVGQYLAKVLIGKNPKCF